MGNHNYGQLLDFSSLDENEPERSVNLSNYAELKARMAERCGMHVRILRFSETVSEAQLITIIQGADLIRQFGVRRCVDPFFLNLLGLIRFDLDPRIIVSFEIFCDLIQIDQLQCRFFFCHTSWVRNPTVKLQRIFPGLMADDSIHGILVELPLPQHLNELAVTQAIGASKDVDGLAFENLGRLMVRGGYQYGAEPNSRPAVPMGVMELLLRSKASYGVLTDCV